MPLPACFLSSWNLPTTVFTALLKRPKKKVECPVGMSCPNLLSLRALRRGKKWFDMEVVNYSTESTCLTCSCDVLPASQLASRPPNFPHKQGRDGDPQILKLPCPDASYIQLLRAGYSQHWGLTLPSRNHRGASVSRMKPLGPAGESWERKKKQSQAPLSIPFATPKICVNTLAWLRSSKRRNGVFSVADARKLKSWLCLLHSQADHRSCVAPLIM